MQKRPLGQSGISIAPLVLGGNVFGWTADLRTSHFILDAFVHAGFDAIDTADVYSAWAPGHQGGESETVIGQWLSARGRRDDVTLITKVGMWPKHPRLNKEHIIAACEESLARLRTDHIDVYFAHREDPATPLDETMAAFDTLVQAGKVRAIGASNFSAARMAEADAAAKGARFTVQQPMYNLMDRAFEASLGPWCAHHNVGVIPYYALAAGFLTGKYRTEADLAKSPRGASIEKRGWLGPKGLAVLECLDAVAARHRATPAQVALAWVMARPAVTAPIVSATSEAQLREILGAAALHLSAEDVWDLDRASA
jgi:aryl-alcohol dehydrogenase-like predicted oxidoreductase